MLTHEPLLQLQRDLYDGERGFKRFKTYIETLRDPETGDMALPLPMMNPMGKEHIPALLDEYLEMNVDNKIGAMVDSIAADQSLRLDEFKTALVLADDALGGWTQRTLSEFNHRTQSKPMFRRGWLVGLLWTSEAASVEAAEIAIKETIYRGTWIHECGFADTLQEIMAQEGYAQSKAGRVPHIDKDDLIYTKEVLEPMLTTGDQPTLVAALYGDAAAEELGYPKLGLSPKAGLELALAQALHKI
ncbi:MAG: hypothetical protein AAF902_12475 [Chloroflexota bacterium]